MIGLFDKHAKRISGVTVDLSNTTILGAELRAIMESLRLVGVFSINYLVVESDSHEAIDILARKKQGPHDL